MSAKRPSRKSIAYQEFGQPPEIESERSPLDLPPAQQNLRLQASRSGRKGKTVTIISGFQHSPDRLMQLLKQLKTQCGSGGAIKDQTLEIQGDQRSQLLELLTKLGYKVKISGG
jgi:translation initiation factor 1